MKPDSTGLSSSGYGLTKIGIRAFINLRFGARLVVRVTYYVIS